MGYNTHYKLYIENSDYKEEKEKFCNLSYLIIKDYNIKEIYNNEIECKWYEHHEDMIKVSKMFPNLLFRLDGIGEENDDKWKKYYKNGKSQICVAKIIFEKFDESKLI